MVSLLNLSKINNYFGFRLLLLISIIGNKMKKIYFMVLLILIQIPLILNADDSSMSSMKDKVKNLIYSQYKNINLNNTNHFYLISGSDVNTCGFKYSMIQLKNHQSDNLKANHYFVFYDLDSEDVNALKSTFPILNKCYVLQDKNNDIINLFGLSMPLGEIVTDSALNIIKTDLNFHLNYSKKINNSINLQLNTNRKYLKEKDKYLVYSECSLYDDDHDVTYMYDNRSKRLFKYNGTNDDALLTVETENILSLFAEKKYENNKILLKAIKSGRKDPDCCTESDLFLFKGKPYILINSLTKVEGNAFSASFYYIYNEININNGECHDITVKDREKIDLSDYHICSGEISKAICDTSTALAAAYLPEKSVAIPLYTSSELCKALSLDNMVHYSFKNIMLTDASMLSIDLENNLAVKVSFDSDMKPNFAKIELPKALAEKYYILNMYQKAYKNDYDFDAEEIKLDKIQVDGDKLIFFVYSKLNNQIIRAEIIETEKDLKQISEQKMNLHRFSEGICEIHMIKGGANSAKILLKGVDTRWFIVDLKY